MERCVVKTAIGLTYQAILFLALAGSALAQVTTATIYGAVVDPSGAIVPAASVTLANAQTAAVRTRSTDELGGFVFDFLPVGIYNITIEASGFKRFETTELTLAASQTLRRSFALEVGSVAETVTVEGGAVLVQTSAAEQLQTFESRRVEELPLSRRNFTDLLGIGTGVTPLSGGGTGDGVRMNGLGRNGTTFAVDGGSATANPEGNAAGMYQGVNDISLLSLEGVGEVQTVKGVAPAEYGNMLAGQVQIITKSGTNQFHGSLIYNFQAENLNARDPEQLTKNPMTYNQFGGSIGGPVVRDRAFFFFDYEGYRESSFGFQRVFVPTQQHRDRLLAAQPIYSLVLDVFPLPNVPLANPNAACLPASQTGAGDITEGCTARYETATPSDRSDNHIDAKGDIRIGDSSNLAFTFSRGKPFVFAPSIFLNGANDRVFNTKNERFATSYVVGKPTWTSETRVSFNLADIERLDQFFLAKNPNGPEEEAPYDNILGSLRTGTLGWSGPDAELFILKGYNWNVSQKIAKHVGNHSFKFGGTWARQCCIRNNPEVPRFSYAGYDAMLANTPAARPTFGQGDYRGTMVTWGLFAQDDWRATSRLTLNLGLRYDYFSHFVARGRGNPTAGFYNADGLLDDQFNFGPIREPDNPYDSDGVNIGPRLGFAYKMDESGKTVLRGGIGGLFTHNTLSVLWQSVTPDKYVTFRTEWSAAESQRLGFRFGTSNQEMRKYLASSNQGGNQIDTFSFFDPKLQNPYAIHWTLGIQREILPDVVFETSYVANRGVKFPMHRRANEIIRTGPRAGERPNPNLRLSGYYVDSSQTTAYHSWQTSLSKRYSHNFTSSFHYTWSKALSTFGGDIGSYFQGDNNVGEVGPQNFFDLASEWGPSTGDQAHYFVAEGIWDLPALANINPVARFIVGGWQLSGIFTASSGTPFTVTQPSPGPWARADYVGGDVYFDDWGETGQYLNRSAFALVPTDRVSNATIRPGTLGRNRLRGIGTWGLDFSLGKNFRVGERVNLRLRADMFNALNHVFRNDLRTDLLRSDFGRFLGVSGPRTMQLSMRLTF